jgi:hypothetical protein
VQVDLDERGSTHDADHVLQPAHAAILDSGVASSNSSGMKSCVQGVKSGIDGVHALGSG